MLSALLFFILSALAVMNPEILWIPVVGKSIGAGYFAALLLDFAGRSFCVMAPMETAPRASIAASIASQFAAIVVFVTPLVTVPELDLSQRVLIGVLMAGAAHALAAFFFIMFARSLALHLGRQDLGLAPVGVLFLFGGSFTTTAIVVPIALALLLCPCLWWLFYPFAAMFVRSWEQAGLPVSLLYALVRLVPVFLLGWLYSMPLSRYGWLLANLRSAIIHRNSTR